MSRLSRQRLTKKPIAFAVVIALRNYIPLHRLPMTVDVSKKKMLILYIFEKSYPTGKEIFSDTYFNSVIFNRVPIIMEIP